MMHNGIHTLIRFHVKTLFNPFHPENWKMCCITHTTWSEWKMKMRKRDEYQSGCERKKGRMNIKCKTRFLPSRREGRIIRMNKQRKGLWSHPSTIERLNWWAATGLTLDSWLLRHNYCYYSMIITKLSGRQESRLHIKTLLSANNNSTGGPAASNSVDPHKPKPSSPWIKNLFDYCVIINTTTTVHNLHESHPVMRNVIFCSWSFFHNSMKLTQPRKQSLSLSPLIS